MSFVLEVSNWVVKTSQLVKMWTKRVEERGGDVPEELKELKLHNTDVTVFENLLSRTNALIRAKASGEVPDAHREAHSLASLAVCLLRARSATSQTEMTSAMQVADAAILVGSQREEWIGALQSVVALVEGEMKVRADLDTKNTRGSGGDGVSSKKRGRSDEPTTVVATTITTPATSGTGWTVPGILSCPPPEVSAVPPVARVACPSLLDFKRDWLDTAQPVVLTECIDHWAALEEWSSIDRLRAAAGSRVVPVECGGQYTEDAATQVLMPLETFLDDYVLAGDASAYLAQHRLFDHITCLRRAFTIPDYCALVEEGAAGSGEVVTMGWLGAPGTVSPCHHDPYHNLLAQVVGHKRVWLFPPSAALYPRGDFMTNTSDMDLSAGVVDETSFPDFSWASAKSVVLAPGEVLFIPRHWWHLVIAAPPPQLCLPAARPTPSHVFSVSFWFGDRIIKTT